MTCACMHWKEQQSKELKEQLELVKDTIPSSRIEKCAVCVTAKRSAASCQDHRTDDSSAKDPAHENVGRLSTTHEQVLSLQAQQQKQTLDTYAKHAFRRAKIKQHHNEKEYHLSCPHNFTLSFIILTSLRCIAMCSQLSFLKSVRCLAAQARLQSSLLAFGFFFLFFFWLGELQQKKSKPVRVNRNTDTSSVVAIFREDMQKEMALTAPRYPVSLPELKPWRRRLTRLKP